jgi:hypothetical protein
MTDFITIRIKRFKIDTKVPLIWLTYFPFVGWFYPFAFKKDDPFAMHHGKQAFVLAFFFTAFPVALTFMSVFIPISLRSVRLAVVILIYLSHLTYFALCAQGFMKLREGVTHDAPLFGKYAKKLNV